MSDHCSSDDNVDTSYSPFQNLPVEVFLHICSFLSVRFLLGTLRLVCTRFNTILDDESIWRLRMTRLELASSSPTMNKLRDYFTWKQLAYHIHNERFLWSKNGANMRRIKWQDIHYSSVDCVKLIKGGRLCLSGSRDRAIGVWNVEDESPEPLILSTSAHEGWIWNFAVQSDEKFYSASWDNTVKLWNLHESLVEDSRFECHSAALCIDCRDDLVVAGLYSSPQVVLFDPRGRNLQPTKQYSSHQKSVIAICLFDNYIVSSSSDKTVSVYDLRADSVLFQNIMKKRNRGHYGKSLSHKYNLLYVGDNVGNLHIFDSKDGSFSHIQTAHLDNMTTIGEDGEQHPQHYIMNQVTSIWHGPGSVIVGTTQKFVRVLTATLPLMSIANFPYTGEVTSVDYKNNILAVGATDNLVEVWKPKNTDSCIL